MATMKKVFVVVYTRIVLICLTGIAVLSSCFGDKPNKVIPVIPEDAPLSEFVIGKWKSENAIDENGAEIPYKYTLEFVDSDTVEFANFTPDEYFLDGITAKYGFTDSNTIFVNNKRIGRELWLLERDDQTLIVHRSTADKRTQHFVFVRTANR